LLFYPRLYHNYNICLHSYLAKSDLDKLIIDGDKDMLKIFNSMGISTTHIKDNICLLDMIGGTLCQQLEA
jgi:hypothetical protein